MCRAAGAEPVDDLGAVRAEGARGDEEQAAAGEHELGADEEEDGVAAGEHAVEPERDEHAGERVGAGGVDHRSSPGGVAVRPETAKAPTRAASSSSESSSKGHTHVEKI